MPRRLCQSLVNRVPAGVVSRLVELCDCPDCLVRDLRAVGLRCGLLAVGGRGESFGKVVQLAMRPGRAPVRVCTTSAGACTVTRAAYR
jgi:hypothetical protein